MNIKKIFLLVSCFSCCASTFFSQEQDTVSLQEMHTLAENGEYIQALQKANDYLSLRKFDEVIAFKSNVLKELDRIPESIENFESGLQLFPQSFELHFKYGLLLQQTFEDSLAIDQFSTSVALAENDKVKAMVLLFIAKSYESLGENSTAYENLLQAVILNPTDALTLVKTSKLGEKLGKLDESINFLNRAIEQLPGFAENYVRLGHLYQLKKDFTKSIESYSKSIELDPIETLSYSNRGYNYFMIGEKKLAKNDIEKSLSLSTTNAHAYMVQALIFIENKKLTEACESLNTAWQYGYTQQYDLTVFLLLNEHCR